MKKQWLGNLVSVVLLAVALVVWIMLPWQGVLAVVVAVALWLLFTRSGRLALAATRIGVASLPQRWGASSVVVVGIAGRFVDFAIGHGLPAAAGDGLPFRVLSR